MTKRKTKSTMGSKKDKAMAMPVSGGSPVGIAAILKECEGVTVYDETRLRVTAADGTKLNELAEAVVQKLGEFGDVTVSPKYGDAAAVGCVWYDIRIERKK